MNSATKTAITIGLGAFVAFAAPAARAQFEPASDHFGLPDAAPFEAPKPAAPVTQPAGIEYSGRVTLAHRVRVNGRRVPAGSYVVSLRSDGKTIELRLKRGGTTVARQTVTYHQVQSAERGYVVVERRGNARRVSVVHAGRLQLVFAQDASRAHGAATLEVLPLTFRAAES